MLLVVVIVVIVWARLGVALRMFAGARLIAGALFGSALVIAALLLAALFLADGCGAVEASIRRGGARRGGGIGVEQIGGWADDSDGLRSRDIGMGRDRSAGISGRRSRRTLLLLALIAQRLA
jgi:hypothetical protein